MKKRKELKEFRTATSKHFLNLDGTIQVELFKEPVHFLNENGLYEEINNTLEETPYGVRNKRSDFKVDFNYKNNDNFLEISLNNKKIKMFPKNMDFKKNSKILKKDKISRNVDKIKFEKIQKDTDIEYEIRSKCLKESIILKEKPETNIIDFVIQTDLSLQLNDDNSIDLLDNNKKVFKMEKPYMTDQNKDYSENVKYEILKNNHNYELKIILDNDWINDKKRIYPVIIDPTITGVEDANNVDDTYIFNGDDSTATYNLTELLVGTDENNIPYRTLLKFDLPLIPSGYKMVNAELILHSSAENSNENLENQKISIHKINQNWDLLSAKWNSLNQSYDNKIYDYTLFGNVNYNTDDSEDDEVNLGIVSNVTELVQEWYANPLTNYGLLIKLFDENSSSNKLFAFKSSEYSQDGIEKPVLRITYKNFNGLEEYLSYSSHNHHFGVSHIGNYTGNLTTIFNVGSTTGENSAITASLIYNSNDIIDNKNYGYGLGVKPNFLQFIKEIEIESEVILEYIDEDGTIHYFYKSIDDMYYDEDGLNLSITYTDGYYEMIDQEGNIYKFINHTNVYFLEEIIDTELKKIDINYSTDNKISSIIDSSNQQISFSYTDNTILISSPHFTTTILLNNNLISSISSLGDTEYLTYNSNMLLKKITNPNGSAVEYEYLSDISAKISKVTEIGKNGTIGNYLRFEYNLADTKVIDSDNKFNTYIFNSYGNVIGITSVNNENDLKEAYGKSYSFGEEIGNFNKLTSDKSVIQYVDNLICDSSFEEGTNLDFIPGDVNSYSLVTSDNPRSGKNALEITLPSPNNYIYKEFMVEKGKTYTFSMYVKNSQTTPLSLALKLGYDTEEAITYITDVINEYERVSVSIDYLSSATGNLKVYIQSISDEAIAFSIDDIQLEYGNVANYYNLVTNSSFSQGMATWDCEITGNNGGTASIVDINENSEKALKIHSTPLDTIYLTKKFEISGKAGDVFNLSFWFKNNGIIPSGFTGGIDGECIMASVFFYYGDEFLDGACVPYVDLIPSSNWQFFSENFIAEGDYDNLEIRLLSIENANDCYITNFSLFKDLEKYSYQYDNDGKLLATGGLNSQETQLCYDNNQLIEAKNSLGTNFKFEHDANINDRIIRNTSASGISSYLKYDNKGNNITSIIKNTGIGKDVNSQIPYYVRSRGTNKYYYVNTDKSLKIKEDECSYDKFFFETLDNGNTKIRHAILSNYYLKNNDGIIELIYGDNNNEFYLQRNENDSFTFIQNMTIYDEEDNQTLEQYAITVDENQSLIFSLYEEDDIYQQFYLENSEDKLFLENRLEYSQDGRFCTKVIDELGNTEEYVINSINGLTEAVIDSNGNTQNYSYDEKMRLISISKGNMSVNFEYNEDNLNKIIHGTKNYIFNHDEFDNITEIRINDRVLINNYYKDNNGYIDKIKYGNNQEITYTYDEKNRLKDIIKNDNKYTYYYDNLNRISKIISEKTKCDYEYDFAKRLSRYKFNSYESNYEYDKENKITQKIQKLNSNKYISNYIYNQELAITKYSINQIDFNYEYDLLGRIQETNINNVYRKKYYYLTNGNKTSLYINKVDDNGNIYKYEYDKLGNITAVYINNNLSYKYYYDIHSQLIKEDNIIGNYTNLYSYDNVGNITTKKSYSLETNEMLTENTYVYDSDWQDLLVKYNDENIIYDEIGNIIKIGNADFSWKNGKELSAYTSLENSAQYSYNEDGIRIKKLVNGVETNYYIEDNKIMFEDRNGTILYYIYNNEELLGFKYNNNTYYYRKNIFGDIIGILNSNYEEIVSYEYDSWGKILNIIDISEVGLAFVNPFKYRGYYYDDESELYYVLQRYYNPRIGRWISPEPSAFREVFDDNANILCYNLYCYCANNPIMYKDEDGESVTLTCIIICACIGLVVGSVWGTRKAKKKGYTPKDGWKYWKYVVGYGVIGATLGAIVGYCASLVISKYGVAKAAKSITKGGGARFNNFSSLKKSLGSCGKGNEWHHIVEQSQIKKSGFSKYWIHNSNNIVPIPKSIHSKITGYYNSKITGLTGGKKVRDWLAGQSFEKQYEFGIKILRKYGVKI